MYTGRKHTLSSILMFVLVAWIIFVTPSLPPKDFVKLGNVCLLTILDVLIQFHNNLSGQAKVNHLMKITQIWGYSWYMPRGINNCVQNPLWDSFLLKPSGNLAIWCNLELFSLFLTKWIIYYCVFGNTFPTLCFPHFGISKISNSSLPLPFLPCCPSFFSLPPFLSSFHFLLSFLSSSQFLNKLQIFCKG